MAHAAASVPPAAAAGQGSASRENGRDANGSYPSDEEILGIDSPGAAQPGNKEGVGAASTVRGSAATDGQGDATAGEPQSAETGELTQASPRQGEESRQDAGATAREAPPEWLAPLLTDAKTGPALKSLWETQQAYRELFPTVAEARTLKQLLPGGAEDAKNLLARTDEVNRLDAAYFSGDARAQGMLAEHLLRDNPRAFQTMLRQSAAVLAARDPQAFQHFAEALASHARAAAGQEGGLKPAAIPPESELQRQRAELARERGEMDRERNEFRAAQFTSFQQSANDAVVHQVRQTIEQAIGAALPAGTPDGARQRIAEDIFLEMHSTLQNDPALTRQVAGLLAPPQADGGWRFDEATRQQVVNLIFGRAKSLLPAVAKRVVNDWTTSVLSANREKLAREQSASSRVDITGGGAPQRVGKRSLTPRDIDYGKTSDEQLLEM